MGITYFDKVTGEKTTTNRQEAWEKTQIMEIDADVINAESTIKDNAFAVNSVGGLTGDVITPDGDDGNFFDIYLNRVTTRIAMPVNIRNGETYRFQIRQDMTGGRAIEWGTLVENTGLTCTFNKGIGNSCLLYITAGTFDWTSLQNATGRKSFLNLSGFTQSSLNLKGVKISDFDESAGYIQFDHPFIDSVSDVVGDTDCSVNYENNFYFTDEQGDDWISQKPFGVTQFTFYSTTGGYSGLLKKEGVYSNSIHKRANVRFEETLTDDFVSGSDNGLLEWREANSNGSIGTTSADVDENHFGLLILGLDAGKSGDCRCSTSLGTDMFVLSNSRVDVSGIIKGNANSYSTSDVKWYFGWSDTNQPQLTSNGIYFMLVSNGTGKARVWCIGEKANVSTSYDTGIDLAEDEWYVLHVGIPSNGGDIHFAINDIIVYEIAQTDIGITEKVTPIFAGYYDYTGTPLPNTKQWFADAFSLKYRMSLDRI